MPEDVGAQEKMFGTHAYQFFYIAIGEISDLKGHLSGFRLVNDNCIGDSNPSILIQGLAKQCHKS